MSTNKLPVIAGVSIRVNEAGLFNLNDLHQASGGQSRHRPNYWFESDKTREYIASELAREDRQLLSVVRGGASPGTYVSKMIAYDYAAWISPDFKGQVYRTFDAVLAGNYALAETEARRAVALWTDAKKNGFPTRDADWMIARALGNQEQFEQAEQERAQIDDRKQAEWRNTVEGFVATRFEKVLAGYEERVDVPSHFDPSDVQSEIVKLLKKRGIKCQITDLGRRTLCVETW